MIKILNYGEVKNEEIFSRVEGVSGVSAAVAEIIETVKRDKDKALFDYSLKFDKVKLDSLVVTEEEIEKAVESVSENFLEILKKAALNIKKFHSAQVRKGFEIKGEDGTVVGQKIIPIEKVGLYVPGGTAAYPSTVLMDSIPAKIAGCKQVYMVTPPDKNGSVNPYILAAARVAGVDKIFKIGGAQAIAALAYGTETVPNVYKIVGPGNAYVAEAKRQVFGKVSIDMIAGPSEILVVADESADPDYLAADLLSQAEHDRLASAVLVTTSREIAEKTRDAIEDQIRLLPREEIARASIDDNGKIIVVKDLKKAMDISNELAPEHLELCVKEPFGLLELVVNAGSVFMGKYCPEALGDYFAGPNHTLPTSGTAKFSNPFSVDDFIKKTQFTFYTREALEKVTDDIACFAEKEGLTAHAKSVLIRKGK